MAGVPADNRWWLGLKARALRSSIRGMNTQPALQFRNSFACLPEGVHAGVAPTGLAGTRLVGVSPAAARLLGLSPQQLFDEPPGWGRALAVSCSS